MIENCLRHKIIRDFLKHYKENRWKELIKIRTKWPKNEGTNEKADRAII